MSVPERGGRVGMKGGRTIPPLGTIWPKMNDGGVG